MALSLRDESSLRARQGESLAELARVSVVRRNLKEAIGKLLTRRPETTCEADVSDKRANILKVQFLHRRYGSKCGGYKQESGAQYLGRPQGESIEESAEAIVAKDHRRRAELETREK